MKKRFAVCLVAVCAGAALLAMAWPRLIGGAVIAPYEDTLRLAARGDAPPSREIAAGEKAARVSLGWFDYGKTYKRLGGFELVGASNAGTAQAQRAALDRALDALRSGLLRAPADAYAWVQVGQALIARKGPTPEANRPLRMSLKAAPYEYRVLIPRIEVAFRVWPLLAPDVRRAMAGQIRHAVDTAPVTLAQSTRRLYALRYVRQALASSPIHLERFNIVYLSPD